MVPLLYASAKRIHSSYFNQQGIWGRYVLWLEYRLSPLKVILKYDCLCGRGWRWGFWKKMRSLGETDVLLKGVSSHSPGTDSATKRAVTKQDCPLWFPFPVSTCFPFWILLQNEVSRGPLWMLAPRARTCQSPEAQTKETSSFCTNHHRRYSVTATGNEDACKNYREYWKESVQVELTEQFPQPWHGTKPLQKTVSLPWSGSFQKVRSLGRGLCSITASLWGSRLGKWMLYCFHSLITQSFRWCICWGM